MKKLTLLLALAIGSAFIVGCNKEPEPAATTAPATTDATGKTTAGGAGAPTTLDR